MSKITIKIPAAKHRAHRVLFEAHSPFKSRTVQGKPVYKRNPKHRKTDNS